MRPFRFSVLQLLLAATLAALVVGLVTSAWRASQYQSIQELCFSPSGTHLAARYSGGAVQVWRLDSSGPKLVARAFGKPEILNFDIGSIHFIADDKLLKVETQLGSASDGIQVRQLEINSRQVNDLIRIDSTYTFPTAEAANAKRVFLSDWSMSAISSYSLKTGRLERTWSLPAPPLWQVDLSNDGKTLAVCDQNAQVLLIDVESDRAPTQVPGGSPLDLSADGRVLATTATYKPGIIYLCDTANPDSSIELQTNLDGISWLALTADGTRLLAAFGEAIESYDVASHKRLARLTIDDAATGTAMFSVIGNRTTALAPAGDRVASYNGSRIILRDLSSGKVQYAIAGESRLLEIAIFTLGFIVWSVVWGIVAKRERLKQPVPAARLSPALQSSPVRSIPPIISRNRQLALLVAMIIGSLALVVALQISGGQSIATVFLEMLRMVAMIVGAAIALAVAYAWLAFFVSGPHHLTLIQLRQIAGDAGRLARRGPLTFWFVGKLHLEADYKRQLDETLDNAEEIFGRAVEPKQRRLIACLDRQCDLDAFFGYHMPIAAIIPRFWTDRLALVCEETAIMQLKAPRQALRSALALAIVVEQKRGFVSSWVATLLTQQIAKGERRPAELRAAIRRMKVLLVRQPDWDPKRVFLRSPRERLQLWVAQEERQAWREILAEADFLLTLAELLLGPDAPSERRQKTLAWLRQLTRKDDPLRTFAAQVGLTLDDLLAQWRQWMKSQSGLPYDPLPADGRWLLRDVALPILQNCQSPLRLRQQMARQLGAFNVAGAPALMQALADSKIELRREAAEALESLSGEQWGDDLSRWQAWWQSLPATVRGEREGHLAGIVNVAALAAETAEPAAALGATSQAAPQMLEPSELKVCWGLMLVGGLVALVLPIALLFSIGPVLFPMFFVSLFTGVAAMVRGAARDTVSLAKIAKLQMMNIMVCDPVNLVAGWIEHTLLRRPHVKQYLLEVNGGRL